MGLRSERKTILNYKSVYENTKYVYGKNSFRLSGRIEEWSYVEIISRIFYKKLEKLLYGNEVTNSMYESSIKKILAENGLLNDTLFDVIKKKEFQYEALNTMLIKIFDFVYFNVKKKLPYTNKLSIITNSVSELLENTYKYSEKDYIITAGIVRDEYPLVIKLENRYSDITNPEIKVRLDKLKEGIDEINQYKDPNEAFLEIMKKRTQSENHEESRLGFAKMRSDTGCTVDFFMGSKHFGKDGITIVAKFPIEMVSKDKILDTIESSI